MIPKHLKSFNDLLALFSGIIILSIAGLSTIEVIMRRLLDSPTTWSLNVSQYLLIWAILLAAASGFQHKSHVSVDFIRTALTRRFGIALGRFLAIIGYLASLIFIIVLGWKTIDLIQGALKTNKLTLGNIQIPIVYLYAAMLLGATMMAITVVFIIIDLFKGNKEFISEEELE